MTALSDPDREVAALAARQLRACGLDRQAMRIEGKWLAAVHAGGARAALSHADAAALSELAPVRGSRIDVTTPARSGRVPDRPVRLHRVGTLRADEVTVHEGIPVTTVARTLLDLAATTRVGRSRT